jgi:hypothetical protein
MPRVASATEGAAPNRPAKLLGRRISPSTEKAETTTTPNQEADQVFGHFAFFQILASGPAWP